MCATAHAELFGPNLNSQNIPHGSPQRRAMGVHLGHSGEKGATEWHTMLGADDVIQRSFMFL